MHSVAMLSLMEWVVLFHPQPQYAQSINSVIQISRYIGNNNQDYIYSSIVFDVSSLRRSLLYIYVANTICCPLFFVKSTYTLLIYINEIGRRWRYFGLFFCNYYIFIRDIHIYVQCTQCNRFSCFLILYMDLNASALYHWK